MYVWKSICKDYQGTSCHASNRIFFILLCYWLNPRFLRSEPSNIHTVTFKAGIDEQGPQILSLKWIAHFLEWKLFTAIPHSLLDRGNRFILLWAVEKLFGGWPFVHSVSCYLWPLQYFRSLLAWHKTLRKEFIEVENEDARLVVKKKIIVAIQFETYLEVHIIRYMPISISILLHFLLNSPSLLASGRKYRK